MSAHPSVGTGAAGVDELATALLDWLHRRLLPAGARINAGTPLFESGLIDSIRILKLIAWTEQATGRRIPDEQIRMDNFRTVERIAEVFAVQLPDITSTEHDHVER
jgi:acyl carrier protein